MYKFTLKITQDDLFKSSLKYLKVLSFEKR